MRFSNNVFEPLLDFFRRNEFITKLISLILLVLILLLCWNVGKTHEMAINESEEVDIYSVSELGSETVNRFPILALDETDTNSDLVDTMTKVDLDSCKDIYEIVEAGNYELTGSMNGTISINTPDQNVHLFLNNVSITANEGQAIYIQDAEKVVISLMSDTENTISDNGDYRNSEEFPACIYSEADLTFNGTGSLTLNGYYKDAVYTKDTLKILDGTYTVKCKRNAFHANDGIHVNGGEFYISTEKNAFKTEKKGSDGRGNLMISGGDFNIIAGEYSFVTTKASLYIYDCTINQKSIIDTYNVAKRKLVQEGCVND